MKKAMKRTLALILTLAMALVLLTACGPKAPPAPSGSVAGGPDSSGEKQTLYVANWQAYCSDADYCEPVFEEMYNCNVEHVYYSSYEDLMTTLMTGGTGKIDCCVLSNNYTQMFREKGLLAEIDREKIPSYADILPEYKDLSPYAVDADKKLYSVPWCFGVTSLGYNPKYVSEEITSWSALWDPKYAGHVAMYTDYVDSIIIGALYCGEDPSDPANMDLDKVYNALMELKPGIKTFWGSNDDWLNPYASGELWLGNMWTGIASELANSGAPLTYVHPKEGTVAYVDYWSIVTGTEKYDLACKWLDFVCSEDLQYNMATNDGSVYCPVNKKAYDRLSDDQKTFLWINPMPEKLCMLPYLTDEQKEVWLELWNKVKAS